MESINLTNTLAGLAAIQRAMAGEDILFTKLEIGDGVLTNTDVSGMTGLVNKTKEYVIGVVKAEDSEIVRLRSNISNAGVTQDLIIREYGIYAKFGNEQEFLFAYLNVGESTTPLPNQTIGRYELNRDFVLYIGNSTHVDFTSNGNLVYLSLKEFNENTKRVYNYKAINKQDFIFKEFNYGDIIDFKDIEEIDIGDKILTRNKRNALFVGDYDCLKSTENTNLFEAYAGDNKGKYFSGDINSGKLDINTNSRRKEYRIVIFGDSISVGSDWSNCNKDVVTTLCGGINNKDHLSNWTELFANHMLSEATRYNANITILNRSIGGKAYGNAETNIATLGAPFIGRAFTNENQTWIESVLSSEPDMIILSAGMNDNSKTFIQHFKEKVLPHLNNYYKVRSGNCKIVVMTTPNCKFDTHNGSTSFQEFDYNTSKYFIQNQQRSISKYYKGYTIDVGRLSNINRYGLDLCNYSISNRDIFTKVIPGNHVASQSFKLPVETLVYPKTKKYSFGYSFRINFKVDQNFISTKDSDIRVYLDNSPQNLFSIISKGNGYFEIVAKNYLKYSSLDITAREYLNLKIEVLPDFINIYVDEVFIGTMLNTLQQQTLSIATSNDNVYAAVVSILELQPARYMPNTLATEMWSNYSTEGEYGQATDKGYGGGVNHPSTLGVVNVYLNAVKEFIKDFFCEYNKKQSTFMIANQSINRWNYIGTIYDKIEDSTYSGFVLENLNIQDEKYYIRKSTVGNEVITLRRNNANENIKFGYVVRGGSVDFFIKYLIPVEADMYLIDGYVIPSNYINQGYTPSDNEIVTELN